MQPNCDHYIFTRKHAGEVMDTMVCLLCGATWPEFYGPNKTGSLLDMPNEHRPASSRNDVVMRD